MLKRWEDLPSYMQNPAVLPYYQALENKRIQLILKRIFDIVFSLFLMVLYAIPIIGIALWIHFDSKGPILFRQKRVTQYGRVFWIHKFRTMYSDAEKQGSLITGHKDTRITKAGKFLRAYRLDEVPQLWDVLVGNMSFVGTRPEVEKFVHAYKDEYYATLLLPAGITSLTSICFKDEANLFSHVQDVDEYYLHSILPKKMVMNLAALRSFSFWKDLAILWKTVISIKGDAYEK